VWILSHLENDLAKRKLIDPVYSLYGVQPCEERDRLTREYHEAALKIQESGRGIQDMTSGKWKDATSATRQASKEALQRLNKHKKDHGC
jgi:hypothetical protein